MAGNCRKIDSHERRSFINQSRQVIMSLLYDSEIAFDNFYTIGNRNEYSAFRRWTE